ncbi:MAG: hypothetical protein ITF98_06730 [Fermentimonas sp.]|nr:hypothetical protein [Fermentimonas sp.]
MKDMYSLAKEVVARSVTVPGVQMILNNDKWLFSPAYDLLNVISFLSDDYKKDYSDTIKEHVSRFKY